jgi:hypothetical protein
MAEAANVLNMPEPNGWGERKLYRIYWNTPAAKHLELEISVKRQDSVHWICEEKKFRVLSVDPVDENPHAPRPFYRGVPRRQLRVYVSGQFRACTSRGVWLHVQATV